MQSLRHLRPANAGFDWLLLTLLSGSLALNVFLGIKVYRPTPPQADSRQSQQLAVGTSLPTIEARDADGKTLTLTYGDDARPTVLYVFSDTCVWCARNAVNVSSLFQQRHTDYRFLALAMSARPTAGTMVPPGMRVLYDIDPASLRAYRLGTTPQTLVISSDGKLVQAWRGAYAGEVGEEVGSFFFVTLPGLTK